MKHLVFCIAGSILMGLHLQAQHDDSYRQHSYTALKWAPGSLAAGKVTVGGEYNFSHRNSVTLAAGIPFDKTHLVDLYGSGSKDLVHTKASSIMAGYRHYLGQGTMTGFYIEPYVKYLKHEASGLIKTELYSQHVVFDTRSSYSGIGAGAQFGVQFAIARIVLVDLFLVGPEANSAKFSSRSVDITNNMAWSYADEQEAARKITDVLQNVPVVSDKVQVTVNKELKSVTTSFSGFAPGFRIGGSIGIRF